MPYLVNPFQSTCHCFPAVERGRDATSEVQIDRALGRTWVMATPEIASNPPTISLGVMGSPRNNTLDIKANTGSSRPKGATRPMEHRAISQNQRPNPTIPPMKMV